MNLNAKKCDLTEFNDVIDYGSTLPTDVEVDDCDLLSNNRADWDLDSFDEDSNAINDDSIVPNVKPIVLNDELSGSDTFDDDLRTTGNISIDFDGIDGNFGRDLYRNGFLIMGRTIVGDIDEVVCVLSHEDGDTALNMSDNCGKVFCIDDSNRSMGFSNVGIIDSGATNHATPELTLFTTLEDIPVKRIEVGNGEFIHCSQAGEIRFETIVEDKAKTVTLQRVLYSPKFPITLLSMSQLSRDQVNIAVNYDNIRGFYDGSLILEAKLINGLYQVPMTPVVKSYYMSDSKPKSKANLWHARLNHLSSKRLHDLLHYSMTEDLHKFITIDELDLEFCDECPAGKLTQRIGHQKQRLYKPLELLQVDTLVFSILGRGGEKYGYNIGDPGSGFTQGFTMKLKSEATDYIIQYIEWCKNQFDRYPKAVRFDQGETFTNRFTDWCDARGIEWGYTPTNQSFKNGVERLNRTIQEIMRIHFQAASHLPLELWPYSFHYAHYCLRRIPAPARLGHVTPYELMYDSKPRIGHLRIFGCTAYVYLQPRQREKGKLASRATKGSFIGIDAHSKGYLVYLPEEKKVISSPNVITEENALLEGDLNFPEIDPRVDVLFENLEQSPVDNDRTSVTFHSEVEIIPDETMVEDVHVENEVPVVENSVEDAGNGNDDGNDDEVLEDNVVEQPQEQLQNLRRSTRIRKSALDDEIYAFSATNDLDDRSLDQPTLSEAQQRHDWNEWHAAIHQELESLDDMNVFKVEKLPPGRQALPSTWVLKRKRNESGQITKYKARLCVRGDRQIADIDFQDTYAPTADATTVRLMFALLVQLSLYMVQLDVKNAFATAELPEEIYMKPP